MNALLRKALRVGAIRCLGRACRTFYDNNCVIHAAGLTYFSLLAAVPILCLSLFAARICGVDRLAREAIDGQIDQMIIQVERGQENGLASLASTSEETRTARRAVAHELGGQLRAISDSLFDRIEKFSIGTLGWIGFGFLIWSVLSSLSMVETSFNSIWSVDRPRPIWKRAALYLGSLVVVPTLGAFAASLPVLGALKAAISSTLGASSMTSWAGEGLLRVVDSPLLKIVFSLVVPNLALALLFWIVPNRPVRWRPALLGGFLTVVLLAGWMKLCTVAQIGIANTSSLYGSFAVLPILLTWLYMSWQIVLFGACLVQAVHEG